MAKRYRVIGRPAGAPLPLLQDRAIGEEFDADLDRDQERRLLDLGALEVARQHVKPETVRESSAKESK